jgi:hypothetical protein
MKGCLTSIGALVVFAVVIAAIAGGKSSGTTTTTETAETPTTSASPVSEEAQTLSRGPIPASTTHSCGNELSGSTATSCAFAEKVVSSYLGLYESTKHPAVHVSAYSPVTHREYTLDCVLVQQGVTVECIAGTAAVVFPLSKIVDPQTSTPEASAESEDEDEVGSSSHAGDTKFCEEHHCIGDFTTEDGTIVECSDGTFSHAGGISGACSYHGGEASGSSSSESENEEGHE